MFRILFIAVALQSTAQAAEVFHVTDHDGVVVSRALPSLEHACRKLHVSDTLACIDAGATSTGEITYETDAYRVIAVHEAVFLGDARPAPTSTLAAR